MCLNGSWIAKNKLKCSKKSATTHRALSTKNPGDVASADPKRVWTRTLKSSNTTKTTWNRVAPSLPLMAGWLTTQTTRPSSNTWSSNGSSSRLTSRKRMTRWRSWMRHRGSNRMTAGRPRMTWFSNRCSSIGSRRNRQRVTMRGCILRIICHRWIKIRLWKVGCSMIVMIKTIHMTIHRTWHRPQWEEASRCRIRHRSLDKEQMRRSHRKAQLPKISQTALLLSLWDLLSTLREEESLGRPMLLVLEWVVYFRIRLEMPLVTK